MMNEIERAELEAENDGYRNEFQRAMAVSMMEPHRDDRAYALELVAKGLFVAVELVPRHCRVTDAIIGEHVNVIRTGATRKEVADGIADMQFDPDASVQIWPHNDAFEAPAPVNDDGIPF